MLLCVDRDLLPVKSDSLGQFVGSSMQLIESRSSLIDATASRSVTGARHPTEQKFVASIGAACYSEGGVHDIYTSWAGREMIGRSSPIHLFFKKNLFSTLLTSVRIVAIKTLI